MSDYDINDPYQGKTPEEFWRAIEAGEGIDLTEALAKQVASRPISPIEMDYLLKKYAYLEICDREDPRYEGGGSPKFVRSRSGWLIHDHGNFCCISPGRFLYGYHPSGKDGLAINDREDDDGGEGGGGDPFLWGEGNPTRMIVESARDMVYYAMSKWSGIQMVAGHQMMQRMAWIVAQLHDYPLEGYEPSIEDEVIYDWADNLVDNIVRKEKKVKKPSPKPR